MSFRKLQKGESYIEKTMKNLVKLCLHLGYQAQNSFHFDDIFFMENFKNSKFKFCQFLNYRRHLTVILGNIGTKIDLPL